MSNVAWNDAWNAGQAVLRRRMERARPFRIAGWTREAINDAHVVPDLERTVVALVPGIPGHTTGIVAAGRTGDGHFYVLGDYSMAGSPEQITAQALAGYRLLKADLILGFVNEIGDYLEALLRLADPGVRYKQVTAFRGLALRAKPVGDLYEQGRVHHAEVFPELEDRMVTWDGIHSKARIGALVCAITELSAPE